MAQLVVKRIGGFLAKELHPFGVDCHIEDYIRNQRGGMGRMNHVEKVQMLEEVQEIRNLILKLDKSADTNSDKSLGAGDRGGGGPDVKGRRVLDLF